MLHHPPKEADLQPCGPRQECFDLKGRRKSQLAHPLHGEHLWWMRPCLCAKVLCVPVPVCPKDAEASLTSTWASVEVRAGRRGWSPAEAVSRNRRSWTPASQRLRSAPYSAEETRAPPAHWGARNCQRATWTDLSDRFRDVQSGEENIA